MGEGGKAIVDGAELEIKHSSGVRNAGVVRLPSHLFGKQKLEVGNTLEIHSALKTHARESVLKSTA